MEETAKDVANKNSIKIENENIKQELLKIDNNINIGTKYLKIDSLEVGEEKQFELGFKYDNVSSVKITVAGNDDVLKATPEELEITPPFGPAGILQLVFLGRLFV